MSLTSLQQAEILALREKNLTPKQIARKLGCKVSDVSQFLKNTATAIVYGSIEYAQSMGLSGF